ncbi:penicillin-binding protein 2 [Candidatus Dependentiae bacterium]|nr:penicillin-binding protein 2 [Candidatus Dependentiae bacterium]
MNMSLTQKIRLATIFGIFIILYFVVLINLYVIQIFNHDFYASIADNQYKVKITSYPIRAPIYDRNGKPLTLNKESLAAFITPKNLENKIAILNFLKKNFPAAYARIKEKPDENFIYVKRKLTENEIKIIEESNLKDIKFLKEPARFYTCDSCGPILGITDIDNQGLFGLELVFNKKLAGMPSTYLIDMDARSGHFYFSKKLKEAGNEGSGITLTIDNELQFLAYEELEETIKNFEAKEGSVLIMNPENGQILAMVNYPDFDPNNFTGDIDKTKNKIVTDVHEFGSVIKAFMALAAIDEKVVDVDETIDCENTKSTYIDRTLVNTWKAHGQIPFSDVIKQSNNIGVAKVAKKLGPKLYEHYTKLGFGKKTDLQFPAEPTGFVNPPNKWSRPSIISLSFGYEINGTILQLAKAFSVFANGGYLVEPTLILENETKKIKPIYSQETLEILRNILQETVSDGTAHKAKLDGFNVLGKTGSARLIVDGTYQPNKNIFTFAGIIEKNSYKRLIITFIKEPNRKDVYASSVTAPLFKNIAEKMIIYEKQI